MSVVNDSVNHMHHSYAYNDCNRKPIHFDETIQAFQNHAPHQAMLKQEHVQIPVEVERRIPYPKINVKDRLLHVIKPVIKEQVVEIPEIEWVEKVVEVPQYVYKERIVQVPCPSFHNVTLPQQHTTHCINNYSSSHTHSYPSFSVSYPILNPSYTPQPWQIYPS